MFYQLNTFHGVNRCVWPIEQWLKRVPEGMRRGMRHLYVSSRWEGGEWELYLEKVRLWGCKVRCVGEGERREKLCFEKGRGRVFCLRLEQ
jgi:hypothetical protein